MSESGKPLIEDQPDPKDAQGEVDNAVDLLLDLVTGKKTVRDVARTAFEKAFGGDEKKTPPVKPDLRAIDGGR